jgi:hypothetical protein
MAREPDRPRPISLGTVLAGVYLAGLPTVYALFAHELAEPMPVVRGALLALWFAAAVVVGVAAARRDVAVGKLAEKEERRVRRVEERLEAALGDAVQALLDTEGARAGVSYTLFRPEGGTLAPMYDPDHAEWQRWPPGTGVVGRAWERNGLIILGEQELRDPRLGLTEEQQARYGDLKLVGATPVESSLGSRLGVLGMASRRDRSADHAALANDLIGVAASVGTLLGDVLYA